jgi:hypothetical protein
MTTPHDPIYAGHRYPAEIISYAVWLYLRFPLSLRMVEEMLAARGISVTHETIRQWGLKFRMSFDTPFRRAGSRHAARFATGGPSVFTDPMGVDSSPLPGRVRLLDYSGDNDASRRSAIP